MNENLVRQLVPHYDPADGTRFRTEPEKYRVRWFCGCEREYVSKHFADYPHPAQCPKWWHRRKQDSNRKTQIERRWSV